MSHSEAQGFAVRGLWVEASSSGHQLCCLEGNTQPLSFLLYQMEIEQICKALVQHLVPTTHPSETYLWYYSCGLRREFLGDAGRGRSWHPRSSKDRSRAGHRGWCTHQAGGSREGRQGELKLSIAAKLLTLGIPRSVRSEILPGMLPEHIRALHRFPRGAATPGPPLPAPPWRPSQTHKGGVAGLFFYGWENDPPCLLNPSFPGVT